MKLKTISAGLGGVVAKGLMVAGLLGAWGCKEVFQKSLDNSTVTLVAPGDNVASDSTTQNFYWEPVDTSVNYELVIVTPRFDSVVSLVADTTLNTNVLQLTLGPAQYQWRVRAFNSVSTTPFCTPWTITIN